MKCTAPLLALGLALLSSSASPAGARGNAALGTIPVGRVVLVELEDGSRVKGRVSRIDSAGVVLERDTGAPIRVAWELIRRVAIARTLAQIRRERAQRRRERAQTQRERSRVGQVRAASTATLRGWRPASFYVEWLGLRILAGKYLEDDREGDTELAIGGFELTMFTLHWRYVYWEIARIVLCGPILGVGTSLGVPLRLDAAGHHELRIGGHLTANLIMVGAQKKYVLGASGAELYYHYRMYESFGFHIGLRQHSFPAALTVIFGISM